MGGTGTNSDTQGQSTSAVELVVLAVAEEVWFTETSLVQDDPAPGAR
jgi:hypothetical protein